MGSFRKLLLSLGALAALLATVLDPGAARAAASQDSPAFLLVAGLLLIGLAAQRDHLFESAGRWLSDQVRGDAYLLVTAMLLIGVVSATLNLDTSVAFLTPVLVQTGRRRPNLAPSLLYGCILLSNAGSLLLPGSNLTNLIVLGPQHASGAVFAGRMAMPWVAALVVTAAGVAGWGRTVSRRHPAIQSELPAAHRPARREPRPVEEDRPPEAVAGLGLVGAGGAIALVLASSSPALPVLGLGAFITAWRLTRSRLKVEEVRGVLDLPVLIGLFGSAVGLGTLARVWLAPSHLLGHLDAWGSTALSAAVSVVVNNLPAASFLGAGRLVHPYAVLIGLDLGPNLFVSGSLAWIIWLRAARQSGAEPSIGQAVRLGGATAPVAMAAAVLLLSLTGRA